VKISDPFHNSLKQVIAELRSDRLPFWTLWRELADYYLPKRYVWLQSDKEQRFVKQRTRLSSTRPEQVQPASLPLA